jgi:hypothetical protein
MRLDERIRGLRKLLYDASRVVHDQPRLQKLLAMQGELDSLAADVLAICVSKPTPTKAINVRPTHLSPSERFVVSRVAVCVCVCVCVCMCVCLSVLCVYVCVCVCVCVVV